MAFGRMNPPTIGHEKLVNKVHQLSKDYNAPHHVILSHSIDAKKNPLDITSKVKHARRFFPNTNIVASSKERPTFLQHAAALNQAGHDHLIMVAGSDRIPEYEKKLQQYNGEGPGKLFNFKRIEVKSAGQRDPDAEGAEGMSASKMREHAQNNDFDSFKQGIPSHVPEKHAKELFRDVRRGMGLNENTNRGMFKAVFVTGGPGSGKDIILREAIAEQKSIEINLLQAFQYLADKQKLSEKTDDYRRNAIRNRKPLIINGPADKQNEMFWVKEELEELGYDTMMIFVETTNETSKERNSLLSKMMVESVRQDKWLKSQENTKYFKEEFTDCIIFNNTGNLDTKEEDIHFVYEKTNEFLDSGTFGETAEDWLNRRSKLNINSLFKENKNVKGNFRTIQENAPGQQLQRKLGKVDSVTDGDVKYNSGYTFRTYEEGGNSKGQPKVQVLPQAKEPNFQKDKEKVKAQRNKIFTVKEAITALSTKMGKVIPIEELKEDLKDKMTEQEMNEAIEKLIQNNEIYRPKHGYVGVF